jgi:hypothetical protein
VELCAAVSQNTGIQKLQLEGNPISVLAADALATMAASHRTLCVLELSECSMDAQSFQSFCAGLRGVVSLQTLRIAKCSLHGATVPESLALLLSKSKISSLSFILTPLFQGIPSTHPTLPDLFMAMNTVLCELVLYHCSLNHRVAPLFWTAFLKSSQEQRCRLHTLNLQENPIGDHSGELIAAGLAANSSLTFLNLRQTALSTSGPRLLAALCRNDTLTTLMLNGNHPAHPGRTIEELAACNKRLTSLGYPGLRSVELSFISRNWSNFEIRSRRLFGLLLEHCRPLLPT